MATPGELLHMMESLERENEQLRVQGAMMRGTIATLVIKYENALSVLREKGYPYVAAYEAELLDIIHRAALQSAPKVLWCGEAWVVEMDGYLDIVIRSDEKLIDVQMRPSRGSGRDPQHKVIVLECSVNQASDPNGEQEATDE